MVGNSPSLWQTYDETILTFRDGTEVCLAPKAVTSPVHKPATYIQITGKQPETNKYKQTPDPMDTVGIEGPIDMRR